MSTGQTKRTRRRHSRCIDKAAVAGVWVVLGLYVIFGQGCLSAIRDGFPSRPHVGLWGDYFAVIAGIGRVSTGGCYYFVPRAKTYIDWESEQLDPEKGKYRWSSWCTLWRFFRK